MVLPDTVVSLGIAISLILLQSTTATDESVDLLTSLDPYLSVLLVAILTAVGRFVWKNHGRSTANETRIDRLSRTLYGDDQDATHDGIAQQLQDLSDQLDNIDRRLEDIEQTVEKLSD